MQSNSTPVKKPRPDFPLFPHQTGRWAKKVRGKTVYFGRLADDPKGETALQLWLAQRDDLLAGRTPREPTTELTVRTLLNKYLLAKDAAVVAGEMAPRTRRDLKPTCDRISSVFGLDTRVLDLTPEHFDRLRAEMAKTLALNSQKTEMAKTRGVFNYAYAAGLIDRPLRYGAAFKAPSDKSLRRARRANGNRMFSAAEIKMLLAEATPMVKAWVLLGANVAYGNSDLATLPRSAVNLETGWITHPRPKTGCERRAKLWPETIQSLKEIYATRPEPADKADADLVFLTSVGAPLIRFNGKAWCDSVQCMFGRVVNRAGVKSAGRGFYGLRRSFRTAADETLDTVAINLVMGHTDNSMGATYRQFVADDRLERVAQHVHDWLFSK